MILRLLRPAGYNQIKGVLRLPPAPGSGRRSLRLGSRSNLPSASRGSSSSRFILRTQTVFSYPPVVKGTVRVISLHAMSDSQQYPALHALSESDINVKIWKPDYFQLWFLYKSDLRISTAGKQM